jgi:hypothetical protein
MPPTSATAARIAAARRKPAPPRARDGSAFCGRFFCLRRLIPEPR